jgi:hypothetical protein
VQWDAWRRDDGRWTLVADYLSGESARHAEFLFDAQGSYVVPDDDEARWLVGEQTAVKGPQPRTTPGPRRLSSVDREDELPLGEDAIELVSEHQPEPVAGDADWIATQASERPARPERLGPVDPPADLGSESDGPDRTDDEVPKPAPKKGRRASVPSWDEIMFGGGKRE